MMVYCNNCKVEFETLSDGYATRTGKCPICEHKVTKVKK